MGALALNAGALDRDAEVRTDVVTSPDPTVPPTPTEPTATTILPAPTESTDLPEAVDPADPPPGLGRPASRRKVTFDRVGGIRLGDVVDPAAVMTIGDGDDCGYWGPLEPSHDGDEPLRGEVRGASTPQPTISRIRVYENPTYRTSSGVGIGTPLETLRRVYGERLVVDRADGWDQPTDGLLGLYGDVAALREGSTALTYLLRDDVVESTQLSAADDWGDDEGCA